MDAHFLNQVKNLVSTANRALEEAQQIADGIDDPELKRQAQALLDGEPEVA